MTQATILCQVSRRTIWRWLDTGQVAYVRTAGGAVRIDEDSLWRQWYARGGLRLQL